MTPEEKAITKIHEVTKSQKPEFISLDVDDILGEMDGLTLEVVSEVKKDEE